MTMTANNWRLILPIERTNLIRNPDARSESHFSAVASASVGRNSTVSHARSGWSFQITTTGAGDGIQFNLGAALINSEYYFVTVLAYSATSVPSIEATNGTNTVDLDLLDTWGDWKLYGAELANTSTASTLSILQDVAGANTFYIGFVQIEQLGASGDDFSTFISGDLDGEYYWTGEKNASSSVRRATEHSGGIIKQLGAASATLPGFDFSVLREAGTGVAPVVVNTHGLALNDGEAVVGVKTLARRMTFGLSYNASGLTALHSARRALALALNNSVATLAQRHAPRRLQYVGNSDLVEIDAYYEAGLELIASGASEANKISRDEFDLRLLAPSPMFEAAKWESNILDHYTSTTTDMIFAKIAGSWSTMGTAQSSGVGTAVYAVLDTGNYIYFAGDFSNFRSQANYDHIFRYNKTTGSLEDVGTGANGAIYALAEDALGNIWAGGAFTTIGGVNSNLVAYYDGSSWNAVSGLSAGGGQVVYALAIARGGTVYAGGSNIMTGGTHDVAAWNGSSWTGIGSFTGGTFGNVRALALSRNGTLFAGGNFSSAGGTSANNIAQYSGSGTTWTALEAGTSPSSAITFALEFDDNDLLYIGGNFTAAGGDTLNAALCAWNGESFRALGYAGAGGSAVYSITHRDGLLYIGTSANVASFTNSPLIVFDGSSYRTFGLSSTSSSVLVRAVAVSAAGDVFVGFVPAGTSGTTFTHSDATTVTYSGSARAHPIIDIQWEDSGTAANIYFVKNETTGATIYMNYALAEGERVTIDTRPHKMTVTSSLYGDLWDSVDRASDVEEFFLLPDPTGAGMPNVVSAFVDALGAVVSCYLRYKTAYNGID